MPFLTTRCVDILQHTVNMVYVLSNSSSLHLFCSISSQSFNILTTLYCRTTLVRQVRLYGHGMTINVSYLYLSLIAVVNSTLDIFLGAIGIQSEG